MLDFLALSVWADCGDLLGTTLRWFDRDVWAGIDLGNGRDGSDLASARLSLR